MYGFEGVGLSEVQLSISELSVVGGWVGGGWVGGLDKRTSWSDLHRVRQKQMDRFKNIRTCSPLYPSVDPLPPLYLGSRIQIVQSSRQYSDFLKTPNKMLQGQQNITRIRFNIIFL